MTPTDARFYTLWTELEEEFQNAGKDLVLQVIGSHRMKYSSPPGRVKTC